MEYFTYTIIGILVVFFIVTLIKDIKHKFTYNERHDNAVYEVNKEMERETPKVYKKSIKRHGNHITRDYAR
jgi:hypothetical protein